MNTFNQSNPKIKEIRCKNCNKLLAKAGAADIEIKCPRCKTINQRTNN